MNENEKLCQQNIELKKRVVELETIIKTFSRTDDKIKMDASYRLKERVKELKCIYKISALVETPNISLHEIFERIVNIIPPSWHYPEITCAKMVVDNKEYLTENYKETPWQQINEIIVNEKKAGYIVVGYLNEMEELDEGPFMYEERQLIHVISELLGRVVERKRVEKALDTNVKKWEVLFNGMTEMVVLHDVVLNEEDEAIDYRIFDCNKAYTQITGIKHEDAVGKLATEVYQSEFPPYLHEFTQVGITGTAYEFITYYPAFDKHFMICVVALQKNQFATVTTDITSLKQMQELLMKQNKELESYLYIASHDLRSPLVNINGFSKRLKTYFDEISRELFSCSHETEKMNKFKEKFEEKIPKSFDFIFSNVSKMELLINGLLEISRTGRKTMTFQKVDMNSLMNKIIQDTSYEIEQSAADIIVENLHECYGDLTLLNQLFSNIIGNALKYKDQERKLVIEISSEKRYNKIVYSFKDNGIGISSGNMEKIWNVFFQVDPQSYSDGEGLGLSIVQRIVDKHMGKIEVESKEGKGSTFSIVLHENKIEEYTK
jgi:signal transduction histidine kinase